MIFELFGENSGHLILLIFQNISHFNILFGRGFPTIPNLLNSYRYLKSYSGSKN